jgi:hypothetical protein
MERLVDPIIADIQTEHDGALRAGRRWRAVWIRITGDSAFWTAISLHALHSGPRSLFSAIAADGWTLGRMIAYSLIAFVGVTGLLCAWPTIAFRPRIQNDLTLRLFLLPQAIPLSIPIALSLGIACSVPGTRISARRIRQVLLLGTAGTLVAFAAMLILPHANQAFRVAVAAELDSRGMAHSLPRGTTELSFSELTAGSREFDAGGRPEIARHYRRAYHIRFAFPAATFALSLIALGICGAIRGRTRRVMAIVMTLALYLATLALAERNPNVPPALTVWTPNIVFTAMSWALLKALSERTSLTSEM